VEEFWFCKKNIGLDLEIKKSNIAQRLGLNHNITSEMSEVDHGTHQYDYNGDFNEQLNKYA
jgi:hypothetical protein